MNACFGCLPITTVYIHLGSAKPNDGENLKVADIVSHLLALKSPNKNCCVIWLIATLL